MNEQIKIDEKYTYHFDKGRVTLLRHGQVWSEPREAKAWIAAADAIATLRGLLKEESTDPLPADTTRGQIVAAIKAGIGHAPVPLSIRDHPEIRFEYRTAADADGLVERITPKIMLLLGIDEAPPPISGLGKRRLIARRGDQVIRGVSVIDDRNGPFRLAFRMDGTFETVVLNTREWRVELEEEA